MSSGWPAIPPNVVIRQGKARRRFRFVLKARGDHENRRNYFLLEPARMTARFQIPFAMPIYGAIPIE